MTRKGGGGCEWYQSIGRKVHGYLYCTTNFLKRIRSIHDYNYNKRQDNHTEIEKHKSRLIKMQDKRVNITEEGCHLVFNRF